MVNDYREDLKLLLRKLFQFESADLDFGIYRIMNKKRAEIEKFIEKDLIEAVDREFESYNEEYRKKIEKELDEIKSEIIEKLGEDSFELSGEIKKEFINLPISKKYYSKLNEFEKIDLPDQSKAEIFSHIYEFFSRYYEDGDFISLRRYSSDQKYAIPYNGEEVYLYWANFDQYYIKTSENYKNYSFTSGDLKVNFVLSDIENAVTNDKEKDRFFKLIDEDSFIYDEINNTLSLFLELRALSEEEKNIYSGKTKESLQRELITTTHDRIIENLPEKIKIILSRKEDQKTLLYRHLDKFVKRNTMDYFIHKDLKYFLERELDNYLKNEVLKISEILKNDIAYLEYLRKANIINSISKSIIQFISQIEDFQRKLFEKKKFVLRTEYVITVDKIPVEMYPTICKNNNQIEEWKILFKLEKSRTDTLFKYMNQSIEDINIEYILSNPYLTIDTKYFDSSFKDALLSTIDNLDEEIDGLCIQSENFQALNLLKKYKDEIKIIYIDPPYNTGADGFIFKDNYQDSSWNSMIYDRLLLANKMLKENGTIFVSIDDNEFHRLKEIMSKTFGENNHIATIVWRKKRGHGRGASFVIPQTEYILNYGKDITKIDNYEQPLSEDKLKYYKYEDDKGRYARETLEHHTPRGAYIRKTLQYPLILDNKEIFCTSGQWLWKKDRVLEEYGKGNIDLLMDEQGRWRAYKKIYLEIDGQIRGETPLSLIDDSQITNNSASLELKNLFSSIQFFDFPKPSKLIEKLLLFTLKEKEGVVLDFFAGSGTVSNSVLNMNRNSSSKMKYILIEFQNYFDEVIIPRIKKVVYSSEWKDGIPQNKKGISHLMKYQYLEQYEDSLDNIEFTETGAVQKTLSDMDDYFIKYMLDFETRGSVTRLNIDLMEDPFNYKMKINGKYEIVDLVETFNYLLGLHVIRIKAYTYSNIYYKVVYSQKDNEKITIIWRKSKDINLDVDKDFIENTILKDFPSDKIYVNGENFVHKAIPIELEFKRQMEA